MQYKCCIPVGEAPPQTFGGTLMKRHSQGILPKFPDMIYAGNISYFYNIHFLSKTHLQWVQVFGFLGFRVRPFLALFESLKSYLFERVKVCSIEMYNEM